MAWSHERVREELESFLGDRSDWPSYRDFQRAGRRTLQRRDHPDGRRSPVGGHDGSGVRRAATGLSAGVDGGAHRARAVRVRRQADHVAEPQGGRGRRPEGPSRCRPADRWTGTVGAPVGRRAVGRARGLAPGLEPHADRAGATAARRASGRLAHEAAVPRSRTRLDADRDSPVRTHRVLASASGRPAGRSTTPGRSARLDRGAHRGRTPPVLPDRGTFPSAAEFEAAGLGRRYRAASRSGGIARWKRQLGSDDAPTGGGAVGAPQSS
jgi:hypothetical protein